MENIKLLCSTGTIISQDIDYDYRYITKIFPILIEKANIFGGELMMLTSYYNIAEKLIKELTSLNIPFPVLHAEKEIGVLMSSENIAEHKKAADLFLVNCEIGRAIGAVKIVLHAWGGLNSDSEIKRNVLQLPRLIEIAKDNNLDLLVENVPCVKYTPLQNLEFINNKVDNANFMIDTRFASFHNELYDFFSRDWLINKKLKHIHVSDLRDGETKDYTRLRPILHPGEGIINFPLFFEKLKSHNYKETITLESPVFRGKNPDVNKLINTLNYINSYLNPKI